MARHNARHPLTTSSTCYTFDSHADASRPHTPHHTTPQTFTRPSPTLRASRSPTNTTSTRASQSTKPPRTTWLPTARCCNTRTCHAQRSPGRVCACVCVCVCVCVRVCLFLFPSNVSPCVKVGIQTFVGCVSVCFLSRFFVFLHKRSVLPSIAPLIHHKAMVHNTTGRSRGHVLLHRLLLHLLLRHLLLHLLPPLVPKLRRVGW